MAQPVRLVTPRLFGRNDLLALGGRRLAATATGHGGLLFLAGEAGIGKSRLLRTIEDRASIGGFAVVRGVTYPRDLEVGAAIFLDLAGSLGRRPELADVGDRISGWWPTPTPTAPTPISDDDG
jgi:hypothetical protein